MRKIVPPSYTSPNPNDYYSPHATQYQAYHPRYQHGAHEYAAEPQELAIEPVRLTTQPNFSRKPVGSHRRNLSELSGDTAVRSELETPLATPRGHSNFASPMSSPPLSAPAEWPECQTTASVDTGRHSVPHHDWQTRPGLEHSHTPLQACEPHGNVIHLAHSPEHPDVEWKHYKTT